MRRRKCRIERNGGLEEAYRLLAARTRILFQKERSLEVAFECDRGDRTRRGEPREVLLREAGLDLPGNRLRDVALKTEYVVAFARISLTVTRTRPSDLVTEPSTMPWTLSVFAISGTRRWVCLNGMTDVREMTRSPGTVDRPAMSASVMPKAR